MGHKKVKVLTKRDVLCSDRFDETNESKSDIYPFPVNPQVFPKRIVCIREILVLYLIISTLFHYKFLFNIFEYIVLYCFSLNSSSTESFRSQSWELLSEEKQQSILFSNNIFIFINPLRIETKM